MRKLFSILFATLILLNTLGYYGLFLGLKYRHAHDMTARFDAEQYIESETITIKVPMTLPYGSNATDFERVDGEFEHGGEYYRLIKQRYFNDTLYVVCVPDVHNKHLSEVMNDYVKTFTDTPGGHEQANTPTNFIKDYICHTFSIGHAAGGWHRDISPKTFLIILNTDFYPSIIHPPERA